MSRVVVSPNPRFNLSPYLYMQFMEPLGATDSSVEAAWDHNRDNWREDVVEATKELAPGCIRWGGILCSYYKWREATGPRAARKPMYNYLWGGVETNQVGTHEFVDLCRRTGAEPLICVNFLSDGRPEYIQTARGENRAGDADEAADWVSYCNDPDNEERKAHGVQEPYNVKLWQIGNETSYHPKGFNLDETIKHTIEFARKMKARDNSIKLIGWGDKDRSGYLWAPRMLDEAGEHLDYVAMHMMGLRPLRQDTVLKGTRYRERPEQAWEELMEIFATIEPRLQQMVAAVKAHGNGHKIAITEGHLSLLPHNVHPILMEWQAGLFHARVANLYERYGEHVHVATLADFCGTRWTVNALMIPVPSKNGRAYLTPAGTIMQLFGTHMGREALAVSAAPASLDISASRSNNTVYLHLVNTDVCHSETVELSVEGRQVQKATAYLIAPESLSVAVSSVEPAVFAPQEVPLAAGDTVTWVCPKGAVAAIELELAENGHRLECQE